MRVACNRCQVKFDLPEERLAAGAVKVRCSECGNTFVVRRRARPPEDGSDAESPVAVTGAAAGATEEREAAPEASFDDFDFDGSSGGFDSTAQPPTEALGDDVPAPTDRREESLPPIGELDLGGFEDSLDDDLRTIEDLDLGALEDELPGDALDLEEPLERVREADLVSPPMPRGAPMQGASDDSPRLDIQRGPRRAAEGTKSPVLPSARGHSPLLWVVIVVAVVTVGFTGYLFYTQRDAAFTFFSPARIRQLWERRVVEAKLEAVEVQGYYKDLPADRRVFVIQGSVTNRSPGPQSLIKVRGELFGADGASLARREVFCGNVLSETELATLPLATIEARLQNEVGEGLRNVDIAPQAQVPFMVVFPAPPADVEKFNVVVTEARSGSGS